MTIPTTVDHFIANAIYLEQKSAAYTTEQLKSWAQQHRLAHRLDPIDKLMMSIDKFTSELDRESTRAQIQHQPQLVGLEGRQ